VDVGLAEPPIVVLVAEDEPNLRLLVRATIESDQYAVLEAADGDEAWRLIMAHRPALALLDVRMPGRSGLELVRAIRANPDLSAMVIVLLSSQADQEDIRAGLAAGADRYLTKPFSPLQLVSIVAEVLTP
jgi:CheY-like chemotaxis protein